MPVKPKAYSYVRFSTPEQSKGDSLRRQMKLAVDYCNLHGLEIDDESYHDKGLSAFKGLNLETGELGRFLYGLKEKIIETPCYLLLEHLDRVSRQNARKAVRALEDICEYGVTVVTLSDGKAYTNASLDGMDFLFSIMLFMQANVESEKKSQRLKSSWQGKREKIAEKPLTAKCPAWLHLVGGKFEAIPERAAIVLRIFDEFLKGKGKHAIAEDLNLDKVPVFGRGAAWGKSYVAKMLSSSTVVGTLTPHVIFQDHSPTL